MKTLSGELRAGLADYWQIADDILRQGGVELKPPGEADFSFKRNFFSLLFLYSFHRARLPKPRRILYAAALQCLRGMVTGCDNLLDDEYKKTLDTDIPETALRFRSVIDIMVSDRVLFQLLLEACRRQEITMDQVAAATSASMRTMTRSGVQEASEEAGITTIIAPDELLQTVHHHKTGMLFTCPWDIPLAIEEMDESSVTPLLQGLYRTGMGCQVMDDMVDFTSDLERKRHNFLVSLIHHSQNQVEKKRLQELLAARGRQLLTVDLTTDFPASLSEAAATASRFLASGLSLLFSADHQSLVTPASQFLKERIGADRFMGMAR
ncbi:MAG: class 1 isoprenoid biosynthesis enzyme [Deltaproteobacteria bacterium]|nr:class 1 isoprenoid biosynthesis enzyme [Candidatus Anaeroferrophillus wilburensis]MBN2888218.1 class 1 isoprenoid biosynthesis enzyme [Deltaproteobacteria bacterium]